MTLRADMAPHVAHLIDLAKGCSSVLEFGVATGTGTRALLLGMDPNGALVSVDIAGNSAVADEVRYDPRWTFISGDSTAPESIMCYPRQPDLVFIDSGHSYDLTWRELLVAGYLRAKKIALHDYLFSLEVDPNCRVKQAVDEFLLTGVYEWEALHESEWGLAVLRLRDI